MDSLAFVAVKHTETEEFLSGQTYLRFSQSTRKVALELLSVCHICSRREMVSRRVAREFLVPLLNFVAHLVFTAAMIAVISLVFQTCASLLQFTAFRLELKAATI